MLRGEFRDEDFEQDEEQKEKTDFYQGADKNLIPQQSLVKVKILPIAEQAVTHYKKALEKDENFIESRFHVSLMYRKIYKFAEALKELEKVIDKLKKDNIVDKTVLN